MATIVCQGLQSCLESQLMESRILRLKLSSPKTHFNHHQHHHQHQPIEFNLKPSNFAEKLETDQIPDFGGWSVLQALSANPKDEKQQPYVPPHITKSTTLSDKSLELCTENIGNETGTNIVVEDNIFSSSSRCTFDSKNSSNKQKKASQAAARSRSFPPPLTSMSGLDTSLRVRAHREEGRLIIKAIKTPRMKTYFEVERSNDRLQMRLLEQQQQEQEEEDDDVNHVSEFESNNVENDVCPVS